MTKKKTDHLTVRLSPGQRLRIMKALDGAPYQGVSNLRIGISLSETLELTAEEKKALKYEEKPGGYMMDLSGDPEPTPVRLSKEHCLLLSSLLNNHMGLLKSDTWALEIEDAIAKFNS